MDRVRSRGCTLIGAGAVGASLGYRLTQRYGGQAAVAADRERARRYRERGFWINGEHWRPKVEDGEDHYDGPCDLLIIAVKYHHLEKVLPLADRFVDGRTQVISLLNGIASEPLLMERYSPEQVLYGFTYGQDAVRDDNVITYSAPGIVVFGERRNDLGALTGRVITVKTFFEQADVSVEIPEDMMYRLWWKLMVNVGVNQVSARYGAVYREFQRPGEIRDRMRALMEEVIRLSQHTDSPLSQADYDQWCGVLETLSPEGKTSMLQDAEAGRKTEVELFSGEIVRQARERGLHLPENERMLSELLEIENSYL